MRNAEISSRWHCGRAGQKHLLGAALAVAVIGFSIGRGTALAQDQPSPSQGAAPGASQGGEHMGHRPMPSVDDQLKHMTKKLNLSDDQQAKLKPILEDQHKQMEQIHNDSSLSRQDQFSKMKELRTSTDTQIKSVLNEDQQKKFDKMREEQQSHMRWNRGGGGAEGSKPDNPQ